MITKIRITLLIVLTACSLQLLNAQKSIFLAGSKICFVGNSITNNGEFHHNILLYHLTRYPSAPVTFYNCGISGNTASDVLARIDKDVLNLKPDYAVMMIGMNDVRRSLYGVNATTDEDTLQMRKEALVAYKGKVEKLIKIFLQNKIELMLETPSIYDQTSKSKTPRAFGVNDALGECALFIKDMALKYNLKVVDYWSFMNTINIKEQQANPAFTLTSQDRVHPQATGHLVMAYQFIKSMGASPLISKISIENNLKSSQKSSQNCKILSLNKNPKRLTFEVKEHALPFPISETQKNGAKLVDIDNQLNSQLLSVKGLSNGSYELRIDSQKIATFTNEELAKGVNLAVYIQTPQYQQAMDVKSQLLQLRDLESKLRSIKFIEYNTYFQLCDTKTELSELKECLTPIFKEKTNAYTLTQLDNYIVFKPQEESIKSKMDEMRLKINELVQPIPHKFELIQQ